MAPRLRATRFSRGLVIWAVFCALLSLGLFTTIVDLVKVPQWEASQANDHGQRVLIDPLTGAVSGIASAQAPEPFDVGGEAEQPTAEVVEEQTTDEGDVPEAPVTPAPALPADAAVLRTEAEPVKIETAMPSSRESIVSPMAPEITELGDHPLPKRGDKGATPASLYARRFQRQEDMAYISIVLTDAGFNAATLSKIMKLPHEVTVAFSPYALEPKPQIALLHTAGFETWGVLPTQGSRYPQDDPGPLGMIATAAPDELETRLKKVLTKTLGAVGLILPSDEVITTHAEFASVIKEIDHRGLFVLSTHPTRSVEEITSDAELKKIIRRADIAFDPSLPSSTVQSKLAGLAALAKQQGALIVVMPARAQMVDLLAEWLNQKPLGEDVALAPLSAIYGPEKPAPLPEAKEEKGGHGGGAKKEEKPASGHGGGH